MQLDIKQYIDERNITIWEDLSLKYSVELFYEPKETSWMVDTNDSYFKKIYTPTQKIEKESFTHELLHIYIDDLGMTTPRQLLESIIGYKSLSVLTNKKLISILHNFLSHRKMFPLYVEMGFLKEKFIPLRADMSSLFYSNLKQQFKNGNIDGLTDYIGITISFLCDLENINSLHSKNKLNKLQKLSPRLYRIIKNFDSNWSSSKDYNLLNSFGDFNAELENWIIKEGSNFKIMTLGQ